jgi:2-keto-4-pentenoate hydratase
MKSHWLTRSYSLKKEDCTVTAMRAPVPTNFTVLHFTKILSSALELLNADIYCKNDKQMFANFADNAAGRYFIEI